MTGDPGGDAGLRVELSGIRKRFGSTVALDGADLRLAPGEVHGLLGENGAGKSTLLGVLGGLLSPDGGDVRVGGRAVSFTTPRDAWAEGIGLVHQHFALVPRFTVLENLALGFRTEGGWSVPFRQVRERAGSLAERTGFDVPLEAPVETLGVGSRQRVEILKALLRDPDVLVLDEPTAVLAPAEVEGLLELLGGLADEGRSVVLVAHKLDEVLAVADRVTVLRRGRTVLTADRDEVDAPTLARAMVGRELEDEVRAERETGGAGRSDGEPRGRGMGPDAAVVARLRDVSLAGSRGEPALRGVSLEVRRGEVVGVAGVEGNGQRELALVLAGRRTPDQGDAAVPDDPAFIPQDRRHEGLVLSFDLAENLALALHRDPALRRGPFLRWAEIRRRAAGALERYSVVAGGIGERADALSGGNQQRVVVARELEGRPELLVAENPTRGLDVAGAAFVHRQIRALVESGDGEPPGVALISTDLDEILALSDRTFVMVRGRLRPVPTEERSREGIGRLMLGAEEGTA